jgi:enoyl-CoA hydratase/carnithine racemase
MGFEQILFERRGAVALVTLNRPERLNAWTWRMSGELAEAIGRANADPEIGAIVLTGAGRGFCAGADVRDAFQRDLDARDRGDRGEALAGDWVALVRESKPLVAAVNGVAVGVGFTMILGFDVILASERARFGMFFVKMGVVPELASTQLLVQRAGFAHASEMCLSGRLYSAEEALACNVANRVVPHERLQGDALALAGEIAANPEPQLRMIKRLLSENGTLADLAEVQRREMRAFQQCIEMPQHREAVRAFLEKRPPDFRRAARESGR